jgi:hypothetical protein
MPWPDATRLPPRRAGASPSTPCLRSHHVVRLKTASQRYRVHERGTVYSVAAFDDINAADVARVDSFGKNSTLVKGRGCGSRSVPRNFTTFGANRLRPCRMMLLHDVLADRSLLASPWALARELSRHPCNASGVRTERGVASIAALMVRRLALAFREPLAAMMSPTIWRRCLA